MDRKIIEILQKHGVSGDIEIDPGCEHALYAALSMPDIEKVYFNDSGLVIEYKEEDPSIEVRELKDLVSLVTDPDKKAKLQKKIELIEDAVVIYHEQRPAEQE